MNLKDFIIKGAISDITEAVSEAMETNNGAIINPTLPYYRDTKTVEYNDKFRLLTEINFDIAVTVEESANIEGKIGGGITILSAKAETQQAARTNNVSRITFPLFVALPATEIESPSEKMEKRKPKRPVYKETNE